MKKLSEKDDEFCKMIVWENFSPKAAYAVVWNPGDDASASAGASRKMREPHIHEGRLEWIWGCLSLLLPCRK